jgi:hypothetical protein
MFQATCVFSWFVYDPVTPRKPLNFVGTAAEAIAFGKSKGIIAPMVEPEFARDWQWEAYRKHLEWSAEQAMLKLIKLHEWLYEHNIIDIYNEKPRVAKV